MYKSGSYSKTVNYKVFSPHRVGSAFNSGGLPFVSKGSYKGIIVAESTRQRWDFGRFVKTLYFFNGPPNPFKVALFIIISSFILVSVIFMLLGD